MREYSTPPTVPSATSGNLTDDVVLNAREVPDAVVLSRRTRGPGRTRGDGSWEDVTAAEFLRQVCAAAKGLVAAGVQPGDRVALLCATRYEWTLLDYATWFAGAVGVPVYETSSPEQVAWLLSDSGACAVLAETAEHVARVEQVRADLPRLRHVWQIDAGPDRPEQDAVAVLTALGAEVTDVDLEARRTAAGPDDVATLIYTSGTTGRPKGCVLTHGNVMHEISVALDQLPELFETVDDQAGATDDRDGRTGRGAASTLLFLPLAHVFARIIQVGSVRSRTRLGHSAGIATLVHDLEDFRPTFVLAVPRVFEKVFNTASQQATADGRGPLFDRAAETAIAWSRGLDRGRAPLKVRAQHALYSRLVYARLRAALGGACVYAVSGGAPLGERLNHFYRGIGVTILEGYGLTETTAALTVNLPQAQKIGTVGRPLPGTAVRVADDGELLFRGAQVFGGYWNAPEATAAVLEPDGWLHTGDVGEVDDEGFVRVTGRKKEILVTAGGKNVAPAVLEDGLRAHPLVSQCLVVGDGRPFIGALVTIDEDAFPTWLARHHRTGSVADHLDDPDLRAEIDVAVAEANKAVSKAESIRRFRILGTDWTEEAGQLTPSLKLRRSVVTRQLRDEIAALYR